MTKRIYLTNTTTIGGKEYAGGGLVTFDAATADGLVAGGQAEVTDFSAIDEIGQRADGITSAYVKKRKELIETDRYNDNESERSFLLSDLEAETERSIADVERDYQAEIISSKQFASLSAFTPIGTPEEVAEAVGYAGNISTQFLIAQDKAQVVEMLQTAVGNLTDVQKIEVLKVWPEIKQQAPADSKYALQDIEKQLRRFENATEHSRKLKHLKALESSTSRVATNYHNIKLLQSGKS